MAATGALGTLATLLRGALAALLLTRASAWIGGDGGVGTGCASGDPVATHPSGGLAVCSGAGADEAAVGSASLVGDVKTASACFIVVAALRFWSMPRERACSLAAATTCITVAVAGRPTLGASSLASAASAS